MEEFSPVVELFQEHTPEIVGFVLLFTELVRKIFKKIKVPSYVLPYVATLLGALGMYLFTGQYDVVTLIEGLLIGAGTTGLYAGVDRKLFKKDQ